MSNITAYAKVLGWIFLNNIIGEKGQKLIGTGGSNSSRYCYSIWMRHIVSLNRIYSQRYIPAVVAEIGPGDSLGTGFAALLSGAEKYYALDAVGYCDVQRNLKVFDEIVELFRNKEDIPNDEEFPKITPKLGSYSFPDYLFSDSYLSATLSTDRVAQIRQNIAHVNDPKGNIYYHAPWHDSSIIQEHSVDFLFSQAVLEHVDDLPVAYNSMKKWLKRDGISSHTIDFKSHGTSVEWNGHWKYSDLIWKMIRGRAPYLINRSPLSYHLNCLSQAGLELIHLHRVERYDGIRHECFAEQFKGLSELDLNTCDAYFIFRNDNSNR